VLIDTMAEIGGAEWSSEYSAAWAGALQAIAEIMLRGAARAAPAASSVPTT
jgi:hypothetical protein